MNEEEKKTFKFLKNIYGLNFKSCTLENIDIKNIVNIIEKQQDEIEELKHDNSILCEIAYTNKRIQLPYTMVYTGTDNFISKDKIKEIKTKWNKSIAWANADDYYYAMKMLDELLGE